MFALICTGKEDVSDMAKAMRLDKFLCEMGFGSRSQIKNDLKKKQVTVNGQTAIRPEQRIDPESDSVCYKGQPVQYAAYVYYLLNKPAGCVSATEDASCKTVLDYLTGVARKDLFPVGRLDKDTEGLLVLTNDGNLAHRLLSPKKHVPKTYYAKVAGCVQEEHIAQFAEGISIGDEKPTLPARLEILSSGESSEILLTITEGRFHQVKRMFQAIGCEVTYLKRVSMGGLQLDGSLAPGEYRALTEEEVALLQKGNP